MRASQHLFLGFNYTPVHHPGIFPLSWAWTLRPCQRLSLLTGFGRWEGPALPLLLRAADGRGSEDQAQAFEGHCGAPATFALPEAPLLESAQTEV